MKRWLHVFLILLFEALSARRDAQVRFLKLQVQILKRKLPGNRVIIDPADRNRLLQVGQELEHHVQDTLELVSFKTYQTWLRDQKAGKTPKKVGRPRTPQHLVDLVVRFAKENLDWGLNRISGELKKLGEYLNRTSIRRVLKRNGLDPDPNKRAHRMADTPWRNFLEMHAQSMVACDFLCKEVFTPLGKKMAYLLMFVHHDSRKVWVSPATYHPDEDWVCQQAKNVQMWLEDGGIAQRFLIRDNDTKYTAEFDELFQDNNVEIVKTPFLAPQANAFAESWIHNFKRESLNHFWCFSLAHLDFISQQTVEFYNQCRPHQSKDNLPLRFPSDLPHEKRAPFGSV